MKLVSFKRGLKTPCVNDTYIIERCEVGSTVLVDILRLVSQHFSDKVVQNVREAAWNWELLNVLACHLFQEI